MRMSSLNAAKRMTFPPTYQTQSVASAMNTRIASRKIGRNQCPRIAGSMDSRIDRLWWDALVPSSIFFIWTQTPRRMILAMSVTTVEIRTAAPKRVFESLSSRMTGKTMPTECDAKSDA